MRLPDLAVLLAAATFLILALQGYRPALKRFARPTFEGLRPAVDGLRRVRAWQVGLGLYVALLAYSLLDWSVARTGLPAFLLVGGAAVVAILFAVAWVREFLFLMALADDDFPGRSDKAIWAAVLLALPPLGLFLFRAHRLAHWPEPKPEVPEAVRDLA